MSTAYTECSAQNGCHEQSELIYTEVVDEDGNPVQEGESGEVVITTLGVEGMPLIRYKTGDICRVFREVCTCKRPSLRLGPVIGRKDHRIKYKGTTLYPRAIQNFLSQENVWPYVIAINADDQGNDLIELICSTNTDTSKLLDSFQNNFSVTPQIKEVAIDKINRLIYGKNLRKPQLVIDTRSSEQAKNIVSGL
jgi:phenylacetate-CoA ligase